MLETGRGSMRLLSLENLVWKMLRTCHKTDYIMNEHSFESQEPLTQ